MQPIVTEVAWSVYLLITTVSCARMAEPIKMLFGVWTRVGSKIHILGGGLEPPEKGQFWVSSPGPFMRNREYLAYVKVIW